MKILIFSVPFEGHLNILKDFIKKFGKRYEIKLIINGWKNIPANISGLNAEIISKVNLKDTDPALWTLPRVSEQLGNCLKIANKFKPDIIIYDYFALEGYFTAKILKIPCFCSITGMIGPFKNKFYLQKKLNSYQNKKAITLLKNKYDLTIKKEAIEMISDGLHIAGDLNLIWSYSAVTPKNYLQNRQKAKYIFVGRIKNEAAYKNKSNKPPIVYFSLGTVVLNNLWNQQKETRDNLKNFITASTELLKDLNAKIIFVSQGKKILKKYPRNWQVIKQSNQPRLLQKVDIFITHGGNNSFHEAVLASVPMIVIPFFGDQPLVGQQVEKLGLGINLIKTREIDTAKPKNFLNQKLAQHLKKALLEIQYKKINENYKKLNLNYDSIETLLKRADKKIYKK